MPPSSNNKPASILVVDDHPMLRRGLRSYIERARPGATVREAESAETALELLAEAAADMVVMDLHLPGLNGIQAAARIRETWPRTKVLILSGLSSASEDVDEVQEALLAGADGFISKADGDDCLLQALEAAAKGLVYLSPHAATRLAGGLRRARRRLGDLAELTAQEKAVLGRLAAGASYKDIAGELGIGVRTVDTYRTRLAGKLGVTSREELVREARRLGLVPA